MAKRAEIPLWLAAREAAQVVARIQLSAAYHLSDLNRPGCMGSVRIWIEPDGAPGGLCEWGYKERPIPWPYQAISWAAGPIAEARVREVDPKECLLGSEEHLMLRHYAERGHADIDEAMREGTRIVDECWQDILKLASFLQKNGSADFSQVSEVLDLPNGRCIYNERTRPDPTRIARRQHNSGRAQLLGAPFGAAGSGHFTQCLSAPISSRDNGRFVYSRLSGTRTDLGLGMSIGP